MGVKAEVLPPYTNCHHFVLENEWMGLEKPYGSIFLGIPTILDTSLAPNGRHILHIFTTSSLEDWEVGTPKSHRRYLARGNYTYGPMPRGTPKGLLGMTFNTTVIDGLYCVGDSYFPG